ncbi:MAG: hypothetical protein N3I35_02175 [Clostridia bacterium]|nr:hypothetical protein [Clostridia bacterium]
MFYLEKIILITAGIASCISILFIPRSKAAKASFIFLLTQFFSWILGLIVVELSLLDYPVREFSKANATSFMFEYFVLPVLTIFFILYFPYNKALRTRIAYYIAFSTAFTAVELLLEKYTLIIEYHSWKWYWTWISMSLLFYAVKTIYKWFYKIKGIFSI